MRETVVEWLTAGGIPAAEWWVPGYAQMLAIAFLAGALWMGRRARSAGLSGVHAIGVAIGCAAGAVVGARLLQALHELPAVVADPWRLVDPLRGGMVFYGGAIGGLLGAALYLRRHRLSAPRYLDLAAPSVGVAIALGRVGCFLNGCCFGAVSGRAWCPTFPPGSFPFRTQVATGLLEPGAARSLPVHPSQLYESVLGAALALLASWLLRRPGGRPGRVFAWFWLGYAAGRFGLELLRGDFAFRGLSLGPLSTSQGLSLAIAATAAAWLIVERRRAALAPRAERRAESFAAPAPRR